MTIITLTSDFGLLDPYVGIMKGVILSIAPDAHLVDLTHEIPPQDIDAAAYTLETAARYFLAGTVHLVVVDPGVGGERRPIAVTTGREAYVGPDNGLFSFALREPGAQAWVLDRPEFWLPQVSRTFHGRDIFAPVAARLAAGALPGDLGSPIEDAVRIERPQPERAPYGPMRNGEITGHVLHVDRFGNLITDVPGEWLAGGRWTCEIAGASISGPSETYAAAERDELVLLVSSGGMAEVAVRDESAAERLGAGRGTLVVFRIE
jgi:S-adenosyl-L-methionine hydrolase (adenosine-forming)